MAKRVSRFRGVAALLLGAAGAGAAVDLAVAKNTDVSACGYSASIPGDPQYFRVNQVDPFGRSGVIEGAETILGQAGYIRFSCFRPDSLGAPPRKEQAIVQLFEYTKGLGIRKQTYQYQESNGRVSLLLNGERNFADQVYAVRMEFQFQRSFTLSLVTSRRVGDRKTAVAVDEFIESFRLGRADVTR